MELIILWFTFLSLFYFWIIYGKKIQLSYYKFKKSIFKTKLSHLAVIKIGYYYAKKIDNHYYANLITKICTRSLGINITSSEVMSDLNLSSKFGPLYHYRNITGFIGRSILFSLIKKIHWGSGLLIYLNRNHNLKINLSEYISDPGIFKYILSLMHLPNELSILNIMEFVFIMCTIFRLFEILLKFWSISDRHTSIFNVKKEYNLLSKLSKDQMFYFRLGVTIFVLSSKLQILGQIFFGYLILCQLTLIWFIKIDVIFSFIDDVLDYTLKFFGFKVKEKDSFNDKLDKLNELAHKYLPDFLKIEPFRFLHDISIPIGFGLKIFISIQIWPFQISIKFK